MPSAKKIMGLYSSSKIIKLFSHQKEQDVDLVSSVSLKGGISVSIPEKAILDDIDPISYQINRKIIEHLDGKGKTVSSNDIDNLRRYLSQQDICPHISCSNVLTLLNRCGRQKINILSVMSISNIIRVMDSSRVTSLSPGYGDEILSSLRGLESIPKQNWPLLEKIALILKRHLKEYKGHVHIDSIALAIYSFRHFTKSRTVSSLLCEVDDKFTFSLPYIRDNAISSKVIGMTVFGLQSMSCHDVPVLSIIKKVTQLVRNMKKPLDSQAISNVFFGIRYCSSDFIEVNEFVDSICTNIEKYGKRHMYSMTTKELSMTICGLQGQSSSKLIVKKLIHMISSAINNIDASNDLNTTERLNMNSTNSRWVISSPSELGPLLAGLKDLSSSDNCTREFLVSICNMISNRTSDWRYHLWSEQNIVNSVHGLQSLSSHHNETLHLLSKLINILPSNTITISLRGIAASLNGMLFAIIQSPNPS